MQNKQVLEQYYQILRSEPYPKSAITKKMKMSFFFQEICLLVRDTEKLLEKDEKKPWWNGDLWAERKLQINILKYSLSQALIIHNLVETLLREGEQINISLSDEKLLNDCFFVEKFCSTSWLPSKYNNFKERLSTILQTIYPSQVNQQSYFQLVLIKMFRQQEERKLAIEKIKQTQLEYYHLLQKSNASHSMPGSLTNISGEETLVNIYLLLREKMNKELAEVRSDFSAEINKIQHLQGTMENSFANLLTEFGTAIEFILKFKRKYPAEFEKVDTKKFYSSKVEQETINKQVLDDKSVAKFIPQRGAVIKNPTKRDEDQSMGTNLLIEEEQGEILSL